METINFGPDQKMTFNEPLDTWLSAGMRDYAVPEAAGSSARVFSLDYPPLTGDYADYPVIKIMRPDRIKYAQPLFENEIKILDRLKHTPGITPMLGLGFFNVSDGLWPEEIAPLSSSLMKKASAAQIAGTADLVPPDQAADYLSEMNRRIDEGWLCGIILPRRWEDNLYLRCDAGYTKGDYFRSFPVKMALQVAAQILQMMQIAHENHIIYLDHKVLHYFWNDPRQQVFVLDWNIGRQLSNGNSEDVFKFDVLQFGARALHHLMTGRQAQGSVNVGPNKPEDIQNAPDRYDPIWTYDDQERLNQDEIDFLSEVIQGHYATAAEMEKDLQTLLNQRLAQA